MITAQSVVVDDQGRPTRELAKALPSPILPTVQITTGEGFPTLFFQRYANAQGVALPDDTAIVTATRQPTREFLNSGLLA